METPGEHLVGQYLYYIKNCDFVQYNLQTIKPKGEIDVVGINSSKKEIFICEVATHLETGLQYTKNNQPDNINRFVNKFSKNIEYANINFKGFDVKYMLWTPYLRIPKRKNTKHNQLRDINEIKKQIKTKYDVDIQAIYNLEFLSCINELRKISYETTQALESPIMRFLQIEEKLKQISGVQDN